MMNWNNTPCQSDVAQREWDRLEAAAEAKDERIGDIVDRCLENDKDWSVIEPDLVEDANISKILGEIRRHAAKSESDGVGSHKSAIWIVDSLVNAMVELVEEYFEYFDQHISDDKDI